MQIKKFITIEVIVCLFLLLTDLFGVIFHYVTTSTLLIVFLIFIAITYKQKLKIDFKETIIIKEEHKISAKITLIAITITLLALALLFNYSLTAPSYHNHKFYNSLHVASFLIFIIYNIKDGWKYSLSLF